MLRVLHIGGYFLFVGLWFIAMALSVFAFVPSILLVFIAGFLSNARRWPEMKRWAIWEIIRNYVFKFKPENEPSFLSCNDDKKKEEVVIYAVYPHGHFSMSHLFYFALNPKFEHARPAVHSFIFWTPFFATLAHWIDAIPVTREAMLKTLVEEKRSIIMCPAGIRDMISTGNTIPKDHKGFARIAQEAGNVKIIPVWCAEERNYYRHFYLPFGLPFPLPIFIWGRWWCPVLPRTSDIPVSPIRFGKPVTTAEECWEELERLASIIKTSTTTSQ